MMLSWIKKVFGFGLASFCSDFSHEMTVSFVPVLVAQFVGAAQAPLYLGIIASVTEAFASFLRIVSGYVSDRLAHKKPLIALGYGISTVFSTLVGFAGSVGGILMYRMLSFTGSGLREPPRDALIAATVEPVHYGRAFGLQRAMDTLGSLVGPLVAFAVAGMLSVTGIFVLSLIPGILSVFAILALTQDIPVVKRSTRISPTLWKDLLLLPRAFLIVLGIFFIFDIGCFNKLLVLARAQEVLGNQNNVVQLLVLLYAVFNLVRAGSEFLIGLLSDYIRREFLLAVLGCGVIALVAYLLVAPPTALLYWIAVFALFGVSTAAISTLKKACAADMLPAEIRGLGFGILQASEGIAALVSNMLIGILWTQYSPYVGFSYVMMLTLTAMLLLIGFGAVYKRPI